MKNWATVSIIGLMLLNLNVSAQEDTTKTLFDSRASGYKVVFEDNFNKKNTPNSEDWLFRKNVKMGGSSNPQNVTLGKALDGSNNRCLLINFTYDSTQKAELQFKGGGVVSTHNFGYGFYEAKVKLYGGKVELSGLHQSFWSMGLTGTNEAEGAGVRNELISKDLIPAENRVLEIDGFEMDSKSDALSQNHHIYTPTHTSEAPKPHRVNRDLNKWITVAYEWLPEKVNFYADGKLIGAKKLDGQWKVFAPQNFWLTALPVDRANWGGLKIPPANSAMQVDYFRFYAKSLKGINRIGNAGFEYKVLNGNPAYPVAWIVAKLNGADASTVKVATDSLKANTGKRYLTIQGDKKYQSTVKQILEYIPNGEYQFSAMVKSSGKQQSAQFNIITGGKTQTIAIKKSDAWTKVQLPKVAVKNNQAIVEIQVSGNAGDLLMVDDIVLAELEF